MREYLEQLLVVLAVGSGVAIFARRVTIPYNVALVVVGLLLVLFAVVPETPMDPGVVLMVFLPILIFQGALSADATSLKQASRPILALALPGVAVSLLATAAIAAWEIGLPFPVALLLGAVLAITDTVSVLLAFRSVRVPHRLAAIMEGESLFNDGTALVLVSVAATVVMSGRADFAEIGRMLFIALVLGSLLGVMFGMLATLILRRAPDDLTAVLASLVAAFATSLVTEHFHGSPVIAVVVAGVLVGQEMRPAPRAVARARARGLLGDRRLHHQRLAVPAGRHPVERRAAVAGSVADRAGRARAARRPRRGRLRHARRAAHRRRARPVALAARDGVRQHQGRAVDGRRAGAARGHPVSRAARRHRLRRHAGHAGDAGAAVPRVPDLAGRRRRRRRRSRRGMPRRADRRPPRPDRARQPARRPGCSRATTTPSGWAEFQRDIIDAETQLRRGGQDPQPHVAHAGDPGGPQVGHPGRRAPRPDHRSHRRPARRRARRADPAHRRHDGHVTTED